MAQVEDERTKGDLTADFSSLKERAFRRDRSSWARLLEMADNSHMLLQENSD